MIDLLNKISTTAIRVLVTLICVLITTLHYAFTNIVPDANWLLFLATLSGVDVAHYASKRFSFQAPTPTPTEVVEDTTEGEACTDIQEIRSKTFTP